MGWFLIQKKKKSAAKKPRKPSTKGWDPSRTYRILQGLFVLALFTGLAAAWFYGEQQLRKNVTASATQAQVRVELMDLPGWVPRPIAQAIEADLATALTNDPFDRSSLGRAAQTLSRNAWIKRVHRLSRRPGGVVQVHASYRQGAALVQTTTGCHLIDTDGVRLPYSYDPKEVRRIGLPILVGVRDPVPAAGKAWSGGDVSAGLRLAAAITGQEWSDQVAAIDVSNHDGRVSNRRAHLKLLTALDADADPSNNPGIEWGRTPGTERFYEPATAWKIARIDADFAQHHRLDNRILQVTVEPGLSQPLPTQEVFVTTEQ